MTEICSAATGELAPDHGKLLAVLRDFACAVSGGVSVQQTLDRLLAHIIEILPVTSAGIAVVAGGSNPTFTATSGDQALQYESLQTELSEGPRVQVCESGRAVQIADLRTQSQFPRFARRAIDAGLVAVFAFPLRSGGRHLGALNLYRETPGPLSPECVETAETLAEVATAYVLSAAAGEEMAQDRARHAALHDPLTGLPTRVLLLELLEHAFLRSRRSGRDSTVLFIDLDRFNAVNAEHGRAVGDTLLQAVATRVASLLRPSDTLGRLGRDEFVVVCEDLESPGLVASITARLVEALAEPFRLDSGVEVGITASIGIAYTGHGELTAGQALRSADMAMHHAKRRGGNGYAGNQASQRHPIDRQMRLGLDLFGAAERRELRADYQPIVSTADGRVTGFEALVRWAHPDRGLVAPMEFVPLAEQSGLITDIGAWVMARAWKDLQQWRPSPGEPFTMAVNVSARQLMTPGFIRTVLQVLESTDTDPHRLILEVTESVFMQDCDAALRVLSELKGMGVRLALDDFGTGYSSLTYLQRFRVDIVKIDQSFIANLGRGAASRTIVAAVVQLAHGLGMTVVAEGVETVEQHQEVTDLRCDYAQGFYFSRPMAADRIQSMMGYHPFTAPGIRLPLPSPVASE